MTFNKLTKKSYIPTLTHNCRYNSIQGRVELLLLFIGMEAGIVNWFGVDFHLSGGCDLLKANEIVPKRS